MGEKIFTMAEVVERTGMAHSALRFYEAEGLIRVSRTEGNRRIFRAEVLRRLAFIRVAQNVGLTLEEIRAALATLPSSRTPNKADWAKLSRAWRPRLDERIAALEKLRSELTECIGCGCLSLRSCALYNPDDRAAALGQGPRYLLGDSSEDVVGPNPTVPLPPS